MPRFADSNDGLPITGCPTNVQRDEQGKDKKNVRYRCSFMGCQPEDLHGEYDFGKIDVPGIIKLAMNS